jgi:hypothetical protein
MLPAQRHHEVPVDVEDMEDVLTSSVFALLRHLLGPLASYLLGRWAYGLLPSNPLQPDASRVDF